MTQGSTENKHIVDIYVPIEPFNYRLKGKE